METEKNQQKESPGTAERVAAAAAQVGFFLCGIGYVVLPLIIYLAAGKQRAFVRAHAKQAIFLQLYMLAGIAIACILGALVDNTTLAVVLCAVISIPVLCAAVYGAVKAAAGELWHIPAVPGGAGA